MDPGRPELDPRSLRFARLARVILWTEAIALAFWPALTLIGAFATIALFDVPHALPGFVHLALLVVFGGVLAWSVRSGFGRFRRPTDAAALRRLERDSGLSHRPFAALADQPASDAGPPETALWRMHRERRRAEVRELHLTLPRPGLPVRDPWALRLGVLIALLLGIVMAGPRAGGLIAAAFDPNFARSSDPIPLDAWIKPPAYTGLSPILLKPGIEKPIAVPVGSTIEAHVTGGSRIPHLVLGDTRQDFTRVDGGGFVLTRTLATPGTLSIRRGWSVLARWRIDIIPDTPPSVAFANPPAAMPSGALRLDYQAADDYGVASVALSVRLVPSTRRIVAEPIAPTLTSSQNEKELRGTSFQDLTGHPWAGMQVLAKLIATDSAGQSGESDEVPFTLPERRFDNPVARDIVDARKLLILGETPRRDLATRIAGIAYRPNTYGDNLSVFLALRMAASELKDRPADDDDAVMDIEDLLWNAALKIEDGDRPEAEKALRAAEEALDKALKDPNSSASEIAKLTKNLKDAIDREMEAFAENMRQKMANGEQPTPPSDQNTRMLDRKDLADQVDRMQEMAQQGSRQAAQDMLDYIKSLLENLKSGMKPSLQDEKSEKALSDLKDLSKRQRDLMNGQQSDKNAAQEQETLRQSLGDAMRDLDDAMGAIPKALGGADRAMRDAARSLQRGTRGGARQQQEEAAGQLDQAIHTLSDELSDQGLSEKKGEGRGDRDPFGRARFDPGRSVKVPTEREMQRSREILDELRRRAGEHERPRYELDYIERLLRQF